MHTARCRRRLDEGWVCHDHCNVLPVFRYQGVDWRDKSNWHCNQRVNPYGEYYNDGVSLNPYEVMFVKVKAHQLDLGERFLAY